MATKTFIINQFTGTNAQVEVTLTDGGAGEVLVSLKVLSVPTGNIGDLVGFFADFNGFTVGENMTIEKVSSSPTLITGTSESSTSNFTLFLDDSTSSTDGNTDVDNNVNLNGAGDQRTYQLAVQIGEGGLGQGDDYQNVQFKLTGTGLDINDFSQVGVRLQSVGPAGARTGSSKLAGTVPTEVPKFSISGQKFEDLTGNGKTDDDIDWSYDPVSLYIEEDGLAGFSAGDRTTKTDASGNWSIAGLTAADVGKQIYEVIPSGSKQTGVVFQTIENPGSGGTDTGNNFTNFKLFNVSGTKYLDKTGNGISDDDGKLAGVNIFIDTDGNGSYTTGEQTTTTGADGTWSFSNLSFDSLGKKVYETLPAGYAQTVGNTGYTLDGADKANLNFANFKLFNVSGTKYLDKTGNGISDDDGKLAGVNIFIDTDGNGIYTTGEQTTTTGADGAWSFSNLSFDSLGKKVYETLPAGYVQTVGNTGYTLPTEGGQDVTNINFANFKLFNASGIKYLDKTGNGITVDDTGLGGIDIFIDKNNNNIFDAGEQKTTTAADGAWSFSNLSFDTLGKKVYEILPAGYVQTLGNTGYTLPTEGGQDVANLNFANFKLFNVSGTKYLDKTGNGISDDDTGLSGIDIFIDKNNNKVFDAGELKTTTAANGTWSFNNLSFDTLGNQVYEILPAGYIQTVGKTGYTLDGADKTDLNFANFKPQGPGTGTIGYWTNKNGLAAWDSLTPKNLVDDPVSAATTRVQGILIGDFNQNGVTDNGEKTIFYSVTEARAILNTATAAEGQDARYILDKQLVASWLNVLAGNTYDTPFASIKTDIANGVQWMQKATPDENLDGIGDGSLTIAGSTKLPSSDPRWSTTLGVGGNGNSYGSQIKNVLDYYNNFGAGFANDRDTGTIGGDLSTLNSLQAYRPNFA
jgi:hypothetical protein